MEISDYLCASMEEDVCGEESGSVGSVCGVRRDESVWCGEEELCVGRGVVGEAVCGEGGMCWKPVSQEGQAFLPRILRCGN